MDLKKFKEIEIGNKTLIKGLAAAVLLLSIALIITLALALGNRERLVVIPPHLDERIEIAYNSANEEYYTAFAHYFAVLIGNANPSNVRIIVDNLKFSLAPSLYTTIRSDLLESAKKLEAQSSSISFTPSKVLYNPGRNESCVFGRAVKTSSLGGKEIENIVYRMTIQISKGIPQIASLSREAVKHNKICD